MKPKTTGSPQGAICGSVDDFYDDALALRALMQAIDEVCGPYLSDQVRYRAHELLAEWTHQPDLSESSQ